MRTTLTSSFLSGWNTYNQNKAATSGNALAPTYLSHTRHHGLRGRMSVASGKTGS
jgi:hypothetical protein